MNAPALSIYVVSLVCGLYAYTVYTLEIRVIYCPAVGWPCPALQSQGERGSERY
jgi:hypothetical protein